MSNCNEGICYTFGDNVIDIYVGGREIGIGAFGAVCE